MGSKPKVVVTRKLPEAVEARLRRDNEPLFNTDDHVYSTDELIDLAAGAGALLPCHSEHLDAAAIARLPASVKAIANFSVGVDHVDLEAAKSRGIIVTNTPDVLSDATAEIALLLMLGAARRAAEGDRLIRARAVAAMEPGLHGGHPDHGQDLRDHRHGPRGPGDGPPCPRLPDEHSLPQSPTCARRDRAGGGLP